MATDTRRAALVTAGAVGLSLLGVLLTRTHCRDDEDGLRDAHTLPGSHWLLVDLPECARNEHRLYDWMSDTSRRFSYEPWQLRIVGQQPIVVFSRPEDFEAVLVTQFEHFPRGEALNETLSGVFGQSIVTFDGAEWHHQRKAAAKFFTTSALRQFMLNAMRKNIFQVCDVLDTSVARGAPVDLWNLLNQFTLQTFAEVGLGVDLTWIGRDEPHPLDQGVKLASPAVVRRERLPTFYWKLQRFLNIGTERRLAEVMASIRSWFGELIDRSVQAATERRQNAPERGAKSVVELFLDHSEDDKAGLQSEDLVDFLLTFVMAAQDTSALTLSRLFLTLASCPAVARRIHQEMAQVLPKLGVADGEYVTSDHVKELVYLEATVREVLRLYPSIPAIAKTAAVDTSVGGVRVRKGNLVYLASYGLARSQLVWGADAIEFKPERWIDPQTGGLLTVPPTMFATFGAGPRNCIGMKLAMLQLRVVAANLLRRYSFELAEPNDGAYTVGITLALRDPLIMNVTSSKQHMPCAA